MSKIHAYVWIYLLSIQLQLNDGDFFGKGAQRVAQMQSLN